MKLDQWQQDVLDYDGDVLLCTGRRVGKTYTLSRKAVDYMAENPNTPIVIVSLTEDQAQIILAMALYYAQETYPKLIGKGKDRPLTKSLTINKGKMIVRPVGNTGNSCRGFAGGILIVDEAAHMPASFWAAAKPILLTTNGAIWMSSTPFGKKGYFWERYNEIINLKLKNPRFKVFEISTPKVMKDRPISETWTLDQRQGAARILDEDKREMTTKEFSQEYLGHFITDLTQWFPDDLIKNCMRAQRSGVYNGCYLGMDIARMGNDETTYAIGQKIGDKVIMRELQITKKTKLNETINTTLALDKVWEFEKILLDDEGIGVGVSDILLDTDEVKRKIVPINNSTRLRNYKDDKRVKILKEDLYTNLLVMMQRGEIDLLTDSQIAVSLKSIQYDYTEDSNGKKHLKIFGNYSHIVEGIIRMAWCRKYKQLNYFITSI